MWGTDTNAEWSALVNAFDLIPFTRTSFAKGVGLKNKGAMRIRI